MIISCPACATRYAVPDSAIGVEGRVVRCAKCRHSWFQDGAPLPEPAAQPNLFSPAEPVPAATVAAPPPVAPSVAAPAAAAPTPASPIPAPSPAQSGYAPEPESPPPLPQPSAPRPAPSLSDDDFAESPSSFAHSPPFRPRRNPARLWNMLAIAFAIASIGAIAAVAKFGLPAWAPLAATPFATAQPDLVLAFPPNRQDRRTLPNGTQFFGVSGTITNVGKQRRPVPPVLIVLRDDRNRIVFSWEVTSPRPVLAPGESVPVIEARVDIPRSAKVAEFGWKPS